ncbi:hypothetical protein J6590_013798 [Homalodisca vitripennis]|nr:hypothetical protein J6590_013798 [Homalodisca vitripennis]
MSIVSPAKCEIHAVIRYLVVKGKAPRSGRPSIATDELVDENTVRDDRRLTLDELSAMFPQISRSLIHETITETLGYRKLSARWVPKQLTEQHKLNRVQSSMLPKCRKSIPYSCESTSILTFWTCLVLEH